MRNWTRFTKILADEVWEADLGKGWDVVFYGDSITEDYRGTSIGSDAKRAIGSPAVFRQYFSSKYSTGILAVAGDQIENLLYRLQNGDTPSKAPKVAVVLIGTNDFGAVDLCFGSDADLLETVPGANRRYNNLVQYMRYSMPSTHIVLVAILPRAGWTLPDNWAYPNRFSAPIDKVNSHIHDLASKDSMLHYIDCGARFFNSTDIMDIVMPDGLHPNHAGQEMLAQCYAPLIASLVTTRSTADANATAVEKPAPPVNPCKATDSSEQPSTASGSSASGSAPAAAGSHPSAGVEGNVADVSGDSSVLLRRAEALAQRTRTMGSSNILDFAPDLACLLC